ncbi:hypothetical protein MNBD_ALPHA09-260 [hydrothermal vent metagenome]|uniref:Uncharacterized protein n=1 Tax=hydrothermal vent metagenome TaxID=652676 RepID=A0A3B0U156_9ZZZZ
MAKINNNVKQSDNLIKEIGDAELFDISTHLELEALALAWTIRNRQIHLRRVQNQVTSGGDPGAPFGLPDPTRGATHFHRHDETPPWAATQEPTALIGCYLFYDLARR